MMDVDIKQLVDEMRKWPRVDVTNGRLSLGAFAKQRGLHGSVVEIGVHRGWFARKFLDQWDGTVYYAVDPWDDTLEEYASQQPLLLNDEYQCIGSASRIIDMLAAVDLLHSHRSRVAWLKMRSEDAHAIVPNGVDFVYLDGNHYRQFVSQDMELWWEKLQPQGIMAGHDLFFPRYDDFEWTAEVAPVVQAFAKERGRSVHVIEEAIGCGPWGWMIYKGENK